MTPADHITRQPFTVRIFQGDRELTAAAGITEVGYAPDGSGYRVLRDGRVLRGRWRFLDDEQSLIETELGATRQRFRILELNETVYRKIDLDTGIEIEHHPVTPQRAGAR